VKPIKTVLGVYILTIILLVSLPLNTSSHLNNITILQLRGDYFFHIVLFLPWMFFGSTFTRQSKLKSSTLLSSQSPSVPPSLFWFLLGLLFASGTEGLQFFLPWRAFNINDLLGNMLGILLSLLTVCIVSKSPNVEH
jgi:glycopeptide antibiotics resistance protein